jgi:hypothetical protein
MLRRNGSLREGPKSADDGQEGAEYAVSAASLFPPLFWSWGSDLKKVSEFLKKPRGYK